MSLQTTYLQTTSLCSTSTREDLLLHTVPVLKDMLRERGEKVSGRKSELVDRLLTGVEVVKVEDAFPVQDDPVDHPVDPVTPLEDDYFPVQDSAPEEDDLPVTEIPTLSPLSIKILRKSISRLRSRRSLPFTTFSSSPTSIDPGALTSLDEMLGENELVEAKAIMMGKGPVEVGDTVFQIAATLQVAIVERKGYTAIFYRPSANGDGVKLFESNNADGLQFKKKAKCERDGRGRPVYG
ncbi:hypothetical protein TrRE_jg9772 [Triparma retinervis]|uniref:SAP domain-containing protein n=1 Tax=Triparma retinervis TaxID=2557542 RepID=A0A9W7FVF8_9STRA|nr:hypothetical protein TrRE_jg9772 [Triparma retinervis]